MNTNLVNFCNTRGVSSVADSEETNPLSFISGPSKHKMEQDCVTQI